MLAIICSKPNVEGYLWRNCLVNELLPEIGWPKFYHAYAHKTELYLRKYNCQTLILLFLNMQCKRESFFHHPCHCQQHLSSTIYIAWPELCPFSWKKNLSLYFSLQSRKFLAPCAKVGVTQVLAKYDNYIKTLKWILWSRLTVLGCGSKIKFSYVPSFLII